MYLAIILGLSLLTLLFVGYLIRYVMKKDTGDAKMQEIAAAIKEDSG